MHCVMSFSFVIYISICRWSSYSLEVYLYAVVQNTSYPSSKSSVIVLLPCQWSKDSLTKNRCVTLEIQKWTKQSRCTWLALRKTAVVDWSRLQEKQRLKIFCWATVSEWKFDSRIILIIRWVNIVLTWRAILLFHFNEQLVYLFYFVNFF